MILAFPVQRTCWMSVSSKQLSFTTLVLGLGNSLRADDGAGPAAVASLSMLDIPQQVDLLDGGTAGLDTLLLFDGYRRVIIIDAAEMGLPPGQWRRFTPDTAVLAQNENAFAGTLHSAGLAEALALAKALRALPPELIIYGIQPQQLTWREGLSAEIEAALPGLVQAVRDELAR